MPLLVEPHLPSGALRTGSQPRIPGRAVALRPWVEDDVATLVHAYADPDIQRWHCRSLDHGEAARLVRRWNDAWAAETGASWAVSEHAGGPVVGRVAFRTMLLAEGFAELGYWVLPSARGRGVATRAVTALTDWAFDVVGLQRLELRHSTLNAASCRVAATTGYATEGTLRASVRHADGWHDMHVHGRVRAPAAGHAEGDGTVEGR